MAFGMKRWSAVFALLATAVAWAAIPPRTVEDLQNTWGRARQPVGSPEEQHRNRLTDAVRRTNQALQTVRWADSLRPLVLEHGPEGAYLGLPSPDAPRTRVEPVRALLSEEIPPDRSGRAAVGVFFLASGTSGFPGAPTGRLDGYYFGEEEGTPYCFAVRAQGGPPGHDRLALPWGLDDGHVSLTGVCRWIHRYGLPEGAVRRWIEDRGAATATALRTFDGGILDNRQEGKVERRGVFGFPGGSDFLTAGRSFVWALDPLRDQCLAGRPDACVDLMLEGRSAWASFDALEARRRRASAFSATDRWGLWRQDRFFLTTLEEEFGPERFRAFWTSRAPVPQAFEAAFGEPMGPWLLGWYGRSTPIVRPGPAPRAAGVLGTLAVLLLAGLVATVLVRRWKVVV